MPMPRRDRPARTASARAGRSEPRRGGRRVRPARGEPGRPCRCRCKTWAGRRGRTASTRPATRCRQGGPQHSRRGGAGRQSLGRPPRRGAARPAVAPRPLRPRQVGSNNCSSLPSSGRPLAPRRGEAGRSPRRGGPALSSSARGAGRRSPGAAALVAVRPARCRGETGRPFSTSLRWAGRHPLSVSASARAGSNNCSCLPSSGRRAPMPRPRRPPPMPTGGPWGLSGRP
jgi:hypothetical protein